jgi:hypothetical protein
MSLSSKASGNLCLKGSLTLRILHYLDRFYIPRIYLFSEPSFFNIFYTCTGLVATYCEQWLFPGSRSVPYHRCPPSRTSSSFYAKWTLEINLFRYDAKADLLRQKGVYRILGQIFHQPIIYDLWRSGNSLPEYSSPAPRHVSTKWVCRTRKFPHTVCHFVRYRFSAAVLL